MTPAEIENAVIGLLLLRVEHVAEATGSGLKARHFDAPECRDAYQACCDLWNAGEPVTVHRVAIRMGREHEQWLTTMRERAPLSQNFAFYIRAAKDKARAKAALTNLADIGASLLGRDLADPLDPLLEQIADAILSADATSERIRSTPIPAVVDLSLKEAEERQRRFRGGEPIGIPFGMPGLDAITAGMQPGNVYVIGARTGVGKTTLAANFAINAAKAGAMTAFVTVEMSARDITDKILCREARADVGRFLNGEFDADEAARLNEAAKTVEKLPLVIVEAIVPTLEALSFEIARLKHVEKVDLVIVDYLQQFDLGDSRYRPPREVTKIISTAIKTLAKKYGLAIVVLSQLSREAPEVGAPDLRHIAESDQIARDADVVMLLYRDGEGTFIKVAKQRRGISGLVLLKSQLEFGLFTEDRQIE